MSVTVVNLPDLIASTDAIEATIKECCTDYINYWNTHHQAVGGGLSDIGIALDNCCTAWFDAGVLDVDIPAAIQTLPQVDGAGNQAVDAMGNPLPDVQVECPGFTIQADTWAESQYFLTQQYLAPYNSQAAAYNAYLAQLTEYQRLLNIPLIAAAVANGILLVQLYQCWRETIEWAKDSIERMIEDGGAHDKIVSEFCDSISGEYLAHVDLLQEGFAEKWMSAMDAANWQCNQRDAIYACYTDTYEDPEKEVVPMAIRNLKAALDEGTSATQDVRGWISELQQHTAECLRPYEKDSWPLVGQQVDNVYGKLSFLCQTLQNGAQTLEDCYLATYLNDEKPLITSLLQSASDCVPEILEAITDARECMDTMKALYEEYLVEERMLGPAVISQANTLAECGDLWKQLWNDFTRDSDDFLERYSSIYADGEEELQEKIFVLACNMATEKIDRQHIFATNNGDGCIDQFNANYKITDAAWAPEALQAGRDFTQLQYQRYEYSSNAADQCLAHWTDEYQQCDAQLSLEIFQEAKNLVETRTDQHQFATQMADLCREQFEVAYRDCDRLLAEAILEEGKVLALTRNDQWQFATDMADRCIAHWESAYQECDAALAGVVMEEAKFLGGTRETRHDFAEDMATECLAHWQDNYAECDGVLGRFLMEEAKRLYDSRTDTFDTFCEMQVKYYDHWCDTYQEKEVAYVCNLLDRSTLQITELDESLDQFCQDALDHLNFYKDYYQDPECQIAPKIILAADQALIQHEDTYTSLDTYGDALWEKWYDTFKECDCTDLEAVCQIHDKTDLVCDIDDNSECVEELGLLLKNCYEEMLPWEKAYIQELCDEPKYEPQYCEIEDRAVLFVRSQFDRQRQDIVRCADLYCVGDIEDRLERLGIEQAKAEAAVLQSANRFERWWEVQECERRHRHKLSAIEAITNWRRDGAALFQQSTQGKDLLLRHVHDRLVRGEMYLRNMNQALATSGQQTAQTVDDSLQSIDQGHFFPRLHADMKNQFHQSSQQMLSSGQSQTQIGQEWTRQATNNKQAAEQTAAAGIDDAIQAMQHGRQFKTNSISAQQVAEQIATAGTSDGLQAMRHGQQFKQQAHAANGQAETIAAGTVSDSIQMANHGQRFKDQALAANAQADQIAASATDDGLQTMQHGQRFKDQAAAFDRNAAQVAATVVDDGVNMANHGQRYKDQALGFGQLGQEVIRDGINFGVGAIDRSRFWIEQAEGTRQRAQTTVEASFDRGIQSIRSGHEAMQMALAFEQQRDRMAELCVNNGMNAAAHGLRVMTLGDQRMQAATRTSQQGIQDAFSMFAHAADRDTQWMNGTNTLATSLPAYSSSLNNLITMGHNVRGQALNMGAQAFASKAGLAEFICGMVRNQHNDSVSNMVRFQGYSQLGATLANSAGQGVGTTLDGFLGGLQGLVSGPSSFNPPSLLNVPVIDSVGVPGGFSGGGSVIGGNSFGGTGGAAGGGFFGGN